MHLHIIQQCFHSYLFISEVIVTALSYSLNFLEIISAELLVSDRMLQVYSFKHYQLRMKILIHSGDNHKEKKGLEVFSEAVNILA